MNDIYNYISSENIHISLDHALHVTYIPSYKHQVILKANQPHVVGLDQYIYT